jgi:Multicopper oxidase
MDGVPYLTQEPIPPGGSYNYDFPLKQTGTYWMHSHYGLQEQQLASAPMIIRTPGQSKLADAEFTVMLSDFSFTSPAEILKSLRGSMSAMHGQSDMKSMSTSKPEEPLVVQQWDSVSQRLVSHQIKGPPPDIDVQYDALLANRRTLDDPQVFRSNPDKPYFCASLPRQRRPTFLSIPVIWMRRSSLPTAGQLMA